MAITTDSIAKIKEGDLARRTTTPADFKNPQQGMLARQNVERVEPIDTLGEAFSAGIESGARNIQAQNQNFLAAIDTLRGKDVSARNRIREADFLEDQASIPLQGLESDFASALEQGNVHDFMLNFASATGQFIPSLAASLAEAVAVGGVVAGGTILTGGTATPGLLTAAAAGTAARRKAVEGGVKSLQRRRPGIDKAEVEDLLSRAYKNQVRVNAGKQPLHKFSKEELIDLEDIYGVMRSNLRGKRFTQGAVLGAFTQEQRMGTGIAFSDYVDQGMDSKQDAINSILQGTAFGAIGVGAEGLTVAATIGRLKRPGRIRRGTSTDPFKFDPIPPGSLFKDFASISAVTSASEGLAELLQEELSIEQKFRIDDTYTKAQAKIDRVNALFAGLMGGLGVGGGLGAGTAVINKARNLSQRGAAEREMMRIFTERENAAKLGAVMGERAAALEAQFEFMSNENSGPDSVFVPIESKAEFAKIQEKVEAMFGDNELFSVSTPTGVFFTTNQRAAGRLANIMDSGYKYNTGVLEDFLAENLGFSRSRDPRDDIVVGVFDNEKGEFVKYQSAREDVEGDAEAAKAAMNNIRAAMDPKRYTIEVQSLAQHRRFRQEGLPKDTDVLKATKEAFETSDMSEMGTSDDDTGVEGDRGQINLDVTGANIDIKRGRVTSAQREQFDSYLKNEYKLPIDFGELVFFLQQTRKLLLGRQQTTGQDSQNTTEPAEISPPSDVKVGDEIDVFDIAGNRYKARVTAVSEAGSIKVIDQQGNEVLLNMGPSAVTTNIKSPQYKLQSAGHGQQGKTVQELTPEELAEVERVAQRVANDPEARGQGSQLNAQQDLNAINLSKKSPQPSGPKQSPKNLLDPIGKPGSNARRRYSRIYGQLVNAEKNAGPLTKQDRDFLQRMNSGGFETLALELDGVLQEIAEQGALLQQPDSIESSIARDEFGSREVTNIPLVGVSEVLSRTNVVLDIEKPNPKDFKNGRKDKAYIKQLADFRAAQREAKAPIKEADPIVMAKKGSGTVQNPFVDPKTDKGFEISKGDPKADGRSVAGLKTYIHPTLRTEFESQKPFLSERAVQTFRDKAKIEREETGGVGFLRFVDVRDLRALRTATANNETFVAPERPDASLGPQQPDTERRYVIVRMKPDPEQFREITRENVETTRNIRADLQIRLDQANARTRSGSYKTPIHFKLQNLNPEAKSKNPVNIDMAVLLEGISTLSKIKQRRQPQEYTNQAAQRVASLLDAIDILQENNFQLEYYPQGVKNEAMFTMSGPKKKSDIQLGAALDDIISQPDGPGASILRIKIPEGIEDFSKQVEYLRKQFGLPRLANTFYTSDRFAKLNVPLIDLVYEREKTQLVPGMNPAYIVPLIQNVEANTMEDMTLNELKELKNRAEDAISVRYAAVDKNSRKTPGEVKELYGEVQAQDRTILQFLSEIGKVIDGITKQDLRNNPGSRDTSGLAILSGTSGGTINPDAKIGTYIDDIQTIAIERSTPSLDETGLYMTDDPVIGNPIDNTNTKGDVQDQNLFENYQEQQGKEFRGRDRYADLARSGNIKPTFKDNTKYRKVTAVYLGKVLAEKANKLAGIDTPAPKTRANLPFRKQIITNMIGAARNLGLTTNLHVVAAEEGYSDSQLPTRIKNLIDQKNFDDKRQDLLNQSDKVAKTLQYRDFDIILIKTNQNISEGQYYSAFLKELGNSLTFQELEKSLKVPATRKKILQAYEEILKGDNVPPTYTNDDTGIENFMADQFGVAIRKELGIEADSQVYDNMNKPAQAWFKRLAKSQKRMYDQSKIFRKRTEIDETFQEYATELQKTLINPENQHVSYKTKASIETMIESVLGPETFTDKQLRKAMEQTSKLFRSKNLPTWLTKILLTSDTRLRNYGPVGEQIADFFNQDPRSVSKSGRAGIFTLKTRRSNAMFNEVAKILGVEDGWIYSTLSTEQKQQIDLAADDTKDTADLPPRAKAIREYLENNVYKDLGLSRYGVEFRKNFFPRVVAVAEIAGNESLQITARNILKKANPTAKDAEIAEAVNYIVKTGSGEVEFTAQDEIDLGMMKERKKLWSNVTNKELIDSGLALPAEVALKQYLDKVALKYEFEQSGGVKELNKLREQLTPEQQEDSKRIIDSMFGKTPPIDKGWLKIANNVLLPVNIITLLAFTVLASLQDTAGPVLRSRGTAKISDVASVIKTMIKDPQEAAELAREVGVIGVDAMSSFFIFAGEQNFMNQTSKNVSDVWFRVTLLEAYTKFTRVFATGMATRFLQNHARKAQKGDGTSQLYLDELNITADEFLAWEGGKADDATRTKVNEALAQFVDESIVRPNPAQRPTYANDPRYALIWQLKSFFYAYGKTIVFPTLKESHRGFVNQGVGAGVMPLLLMAGILLPITMLGLEIRELTKYLLAELLPGIDGDDPGVNYFKTNSMSTGQYITEIIDRSGMLGPASLALPIFLESHRYGKPFWVPPLGPAAERVYDGITWDWRVADYLPVYGQLDTRNLGR